MPIQAEYIWIDGVKPTPTLRSKTKVMADDEKLSVWGFDGSSTEQAVGDSSDGILRPVFSCPDPIRGGKNILVLCDVLEAKDDSPHSTNTRAALAEQAKKYADQEMIYGIEQEYTLFEADKTTPYGWPKGGVREKAQFSFPRND